MPTPRRGAKASLCAVGGRVFRPRASACAAGGTPRPEIPTMTPISARLPARGNSDDSVSTLGPWTTRATGSPGSRASPFGLKPVIALDEPPDLGHLPAAAIPAGVAYQVEQLTAGGEDLRPDAVGAADDLRPGMVEQDDRPPRDRLPALGQEPLQLLERPRRLDLGRGGGPVRR